MPSVSRVYIKMTSQTYSLWSTPTNTTQEPKHKDLALGLGEATHGVEDEIDHIGRLENNNPPVHLRQGCQQERTNGVGEQEDGHDEISLKVRLNVKLICQVGQSRGEHGGRDGGDEGEARNKYSRKPLLVLGPVVRVGRILVTIPGYLDVNESAHCMEGVPEAQDKGGLVSCLLSWGLLVFLEEFPDPTVPLNRAPDRIVDQLDVRHPELREETALAVDDEEE